MPDDRDQLAEVISEIVQGHGMTLGAAAKLLPAGRGCGTATASSLWRWAVQGAKDSAGNIVRLETARFGGRLLTTRQALARFSAKLSGTETAPEAATTPRKRRTQRQTEQAAQAAAKRLQAAGA